MSVFFFSPVADWIVFGILSGGAVEAVGAVNTLALLDNFN